MDKKTGSSPLIVGTGGALPQAEALVAGELRRHQRVQLGQPRQEVYTAAVTLKKTRIGLEALYIRSFRLVSTFLLRN